MFTVLALAAYGKTQDPLLNGSARPPEGHSCIYILVVKL